MSWMISQSGLDSPSGSKRLVEALDAALGVGEGAFLFERGAGGQNEVGVLRRSRRS